MLLNGIRLTGYSSTEDSAQFELAETTVKDVAALDGQLLTVTDDEGGEVEASVGYSIAYIQVEDDGTIRLDIRIFTGERCEKYLQKLKRRAKCEGRSGHTFKKMIEAQEQKMH